MKRSERKLSNDKKKILREEVWWMRLHSIIIRPAITFIVENFM